MKKQFIYFFKHKNVSGIKIGRTSGETVNSRFQQFKTYSPSGSEIIGFFECLNCVDLERKLHIELKAHRMSGEFFDISVDHALSIIDKYDLSLRKIKYLFNEWISGPGNNTDELTKLFQKAKQVKKVKEIGETDEFISIGKNILKGELFITSTAIMKYLSEKENREFNLNRIGAALKKHGITRTSKGGVYGYLINFNDPKNIL